MGSRSADEVGEYITEHKGDFEARAPTRIACEGFLAQSQSSPSQACQRDVDHAQTIMETVRRSRVPGTSVQCNNNKYMYR